ncbi:unnamed protein product [Pleuronectes platessa]|uniref:Uncharacterized protein n=1 Tax=Pleuronectes platessa TaxID=8262 RepID=A0A9N7UT94_PLEPL|nr:unnamed protein product [Pleuronectes platessa]
MSQKLDKWKKHHTGNRLCWDHMKRLQGVVVRRGLLTAPGENEENISSTWLPLLALPQTSLSRPGSCGSLSAPESCSTPLGRSEEEGVERPVTSMVYPNRRRGGESGPCLHAAHTVRGSTSTRPPSPSAPLDPLTSVLAANTQRPSPNSRGPANLRLISHRGPAPAHP